MKQAQNSYKSLNTLKMYLGLDGEDYWHIDYPEYAQPYNGKQYFWNLKKKASLCEGPFDENGILEFMGQDNKKTKHAINICHYAIGAYELFLETNEEKYKISFLKHANWLCENQEIYNEIAGVWIIKYPIYLYGITKNSVSAMTQGMGISTLTRAYQLTNNEKYLVTAKNAVDVFSKNVLKGGVFRRITDNFICYEEYSTLERPSCVLNGFITALLGLYDLTIISNYSLALTLYNQGMDSLIQNIHKWDCKMWSYYDLYNKGENNYSSYFYHKYHIKQLNVLYKLTGEEIFLKYSKKWKKAIDNPFYRLIALSKKILYRLNGRL